MPNPRDTGRRLIFAGTRENYLAERVEAKTASFTMTPADGGKTFTNRGDTDALTATLPAVADVESGWWCKIIAVADTAIAVATTTADQMVTTRSATATSAKWGTSGEIIGNGFKVVCDGTSYLVTSIIGNPAETIPTIA